MVYGGNSTLFEFTSYSAICFVHTHYQPRQLFNCVAIDATKRKFGGAGATCLETHDVYEALYLSSPNHTVLHTQGLLIDRDNPIITTALDTSDAEWYICGSRDWITILLRLAEVWTFFGYGSAEEVTVGKDLLDDRYMHRAAGNVDLKKRTMNSISVSVI